MPPPSEIAIGPLVAPPHEDGAPMVEGLCKDEFSRVQYVEIKEGSQGCYLKMIHTKPNVSTLS